MDYWITVVDDDRLSLTHARNLLHEKGMRVSCLRSGEDLLLFMEKHAPDLILLDILMPGMDGFETYRALRRFEEKRGLSETPVIFLTGDDNKEVERRGLKAGASDFIHKPFDKDILIKRIHNTIVNRKTIESLTEEATLDKLTGFLNKASGSKKAQEALRSAVGALMIFDLDNFKLVNDLFGHDMGDQVLVAFAEIVRQNIRSEDVFCRIGGDEFLGFFPDLTEEAAAASLEERLNTQLMKKAEELMGEDHGIPLGISIGVAFVSDEMKDYQIVFQYADNALYEVKRNGKHGCCIYDPKDFSDEGEEDLEREMGRIEEILSERGEGSGAMLLGQDAFSWNYRFILRFMTRYGGTATKLLFSLHSDGKDLLFPEMVSEFGKVLKDTLRKTDIILPWQSNRYFLILPRLGEQDHQSVIDRILRKWKETGYENRITIKYAVSQIGEEG